MKFIFTIILFFLGIVSLNFSSGVVVDYSTMHKLYPALDQTTFCQIKQACYQTGIDELYEFSKIHSESNFSNSAVSSAGALGICQLMPSTAAGYKATPWVKYENILAGTKYLKYCLSKTPAKNDYFEGFCKYNSGHNRKIYPEISKLYARNCMKKAQFLMMM